MRENKHDNGTLIGLPYKYTVPSAESLNELYYWDTFFTNIGLIEMGMEGLAKDNVDNILYLVKDSALCRTATEPIISIVHSPRFYPKWFGISIPAIMIKSDLKMHMKFSKSSISFG